MKHLEAEPNELFHSHPATLERQLEYQINLEYNPLSDTRLSGIDILNA